MRVQSCEVNPAMARLLDSTPTTASPAKRAIPVLTSGRRAAYSDPKTRSRTISAATTPITVLEDDAGLVEAAMEPTTSTCRLGEFGALARFTRLVASA